MSACALITCFKRMISDDLRHFTLYFDISPLLILDAHLTYIENNIYIDKLGDLHVFQHD